MESTVQLNWAYSNKRQAAYATANPNSDIDQTHPFEGADFGDHVPEMSDNSQLYGKGHEFATRNAILRWDTSFRRTFHATTKVAGWALAFHCGSVSTQNLGGSPPAYAHTITYQNPLGAGYYGSGRQQPVTSVIEQVGSNLVRKFPSLAVQSVEMTGQLGDWVRLAVELRGSGQKTLVTPISGYTFPTSTGAEGELLRFGSLTFSHGVSGSLADISCQVRSFRFRTEMQYAELDGYCPGSGYQTTGDPTSGQIRNKLEFTRRAVLLEFQIAASSDNSFFTRLEAQTELSAVLLLEGATISGANKHAVQITIPRLVYRAVPIGSDGDLVVYNLQAVVFYDNLSGVPFTALVRNTTTAYLVSS